MTQEELFELKEKLNLVFPLKLRVILFPGVLIFVIFGALGLLILREFLLPIPYEFIQEMANGAFLIAERGALQIVNIVSITLLVNIGFSALIFFIDITIFIFSIFEMIKEHNNKNETQEKDTQ